RILRTVLGQIVLGKVAIDLLLGELVSPDAAIDNLANQRKELALKFVVPLRALLSGRHGCPHIEIRLMPEEQPEPRSDATGQQDDNHAGQEERFAAHAHASVERERWEGSLALPEYNGPRTTAP